MANDPITNLPPAISLTGAEEVPIVQAGTTKRATVYQFATVANPAIVPQDANTVFAGPESGAAAYPTFRALVAADLPIKYYAEAFGMVGDGVTNNVTSFNAALVTIAGLGGGILYFPEGNFLLSGSTPVSLQSDIIIQGAGIDATFFTWGTGFAGAPYNIGFNVLNKNNVGFCDFTITASGDDSLSNTGAIGFAIGSNFFVDSIKITNQGEFGITSVGISNLEISNCIVIRTNQTPSTFNMWYGDFSTVANGFITYNVKIHHNTITNGTFQTNENFFYSEYSYNYSTGASYGAHIGCGGGTNNRIVYNTLIDSYSGIDASSTIIEGIEIYGSNHVIQGNIIARNAGVGIANISNDTLIADNIVYDNSTYILKQPGIVLLSFGSPLGTPDNCIVTGNRSYNKDTTNQTYGLAIAKASGGAADINNTVICGNNFLNNATGEILASGDGADTNWYAYNVGDPVDAFVPRWNGDQGKMEASSILTLDDGNVFVGGNSPNLGITISNARANSTAQWTIYSGGSGGAGVGQLFTYDGTVVGLRLTPTTGNLSIYGTITSGVTGTSLGSLLLAGSSTGTVTVKPQAAAGTYNFNLPTTAGTSGQFLTSGGGAAAAMTWTSGLIPAATGAIGDLIYYNTTSSLANLADVALGSVLSSGGVGVAPSWNANPTVTSIRPTANDGGTLGSTSLQWSDLFLAEGGVINWDNGDATLTQAGNLVTLGGSSFAVDGGLISLTNGTSNLISFSNIGAAAPGASSAGQKITLYGASSTPAAADYALGVGPGNMWANISSASSFRIYANAVSKVGYFDANSAWSAAANDTIDLGISTIGWSNLFLAEGAVIDWDNGDATITQAGDVVTLNGAMWVNTGQERIEGLARFQGSTAAPTGATGVGGELFQTAAGFWVQAYNRTTAVSAPVNLAGSIINSFGNLVPGTNDGYSLGSTSLQWSDLFLAEGGVINWDNGDVTLTQTGGSLDIAGVSRFVVKGGGTPYNIIGDLVTFAGIGVAASSTDLTVGNYTIIGNGANTTVVGVPSGGGIYFRFNNVTTTGMTATATAFSPSANDSGSLGTTALQWSDLFLATGGVINWGNGEVIITETDANTLTTTGASTFILSGGLYAGGQNYSNSGSRVTLDLAANITDPYVHFNFPSGGIFRAAQASVVGTTDIIFQAQPLSTAGYGLFEAVNAAGVILGTALNTNPILFQVNRVEKARISDGGLSIGTTSDPGAGMIYTNSASFMIRTKTSYSTGAGAGAGTITNAPSAGNPTKWIPVDDNGTTRYIPAW